jgi:hypothetical protein
MEVMNNGRDALAYWDGTNTYQYVFGSIIGVVNTVTGSVVYYDFDTPPLQLSGEEAVFGLELNPTFEFTIAPNDSYTITFSLLRQSRKTPLGDVNGDGLIDIIDAVKVIGFILDQSTPTPEESEASDCNGDDAMDILDVVCIVNIILGEG